MISGIPQRLQLARLLLIAAILQAPLRAEESLAERFSSEWALTCREIAAIDSQLSGLPSITVEDFD
ncbi:hypothetical protein, partial [Haloferula sp.]|uniref:hypothetical protein n=1 Tax=Haloferula sp. TaxID=2497595 RepID=UPI003C76AC7A